ncbi:MAG: ABC transporter permease [Gemmatimonadales bacterium]
MTRVGFVLRMAWRESRAARRRLLLFASAISIGVAALVAISSFTANLETAVRREARSLLGADMAVGRNAPIAGPVMAALDSMRRAGAELTERVDFSSSAYVARVADRSLLADVRAVGKGFPFYGKVVTSPEGRWAALDTARVAIVDTSVLVLLGARLGDSLSLGYSKFVIAGTVSEVPGRFSGMSGVGSQVYIPSRYIRETGLIQFGSRVRYSVLLRLKDPRDARRFANLHRRILDDARARVQTAQDTEDDITRTLDNMGNFLQFVGLIALLLGGIGVASGITAFLAGKTETIAVLRCLGARRPLVFAIYVTQAVALGLIAAILGAGLGVVVQFFLPRLVRGILPLDVSVSLDPASLLTGIGIGVGVSVLFALRPLLEVRLISPLQAIRRVYETETKTPRDPWRLAAFGLLAIGVFALCMARADEPRVGVGFAVAIALSVGTLTLTAWGATALARRLTSFAAAHGRWPYVVRQGMANLHRPKNQTRPIVTALGFGVCLLAALYLAEANLLRQVVSLTTQAEGRPNLVFIDIQQDQDTLVAQTIREMGHPVVQNVPIVQMRIARINGRAPIGYAPRRQGGERGGGGGGGTWAVRREYRSTFRDSLVGSETLVRGHWWTGRGEGVPDSTGALVYPMSLTTDVAQTLGVGIGDRITWEVQGLQVETRVAALRDVDWARFETNFFAVFSSAALAKAPATYVILTRVNDAGQRAQLQRAVAVKFANVIAFDAALIQQTLQRVFRKVAVAVRFMAAFSLAIGALVLLGAVSAGRLQRIREGALLKALGATRRQLSRILLTEYLALGVLAAIVGTGLASLGAWAFTHWVLKLGFTVPPVPIGIVAIATTALVAVVGLTASREVFKRTAMEVLRDV